MAKATRTETTVRTYDAAGNLLATTTTTVEVEATPEPDPPPGMYL